MYDVKKTFCAESIEQAVSMLAEYEGAVLTAGGTDVLIKLRDDQLIRPTLISILRVPEIRAIVRLSDGSLQIGAGCSFTQITEDPIIRKNLPVLAQACRQIGSPQIRNIASIGGNICNGAVSADSVPALLVSDARLVLVSAGGTRIVPIRSFHTGPGKTVCRSDELLTQIIIPPEGLEGGARYEKFGQRRAMEIAALGCAVRIVLTPDHTRVLRAAIAFGVAAPTPVRCPKTESLIKGACIDDQLYETVRTHVLEELSPRDSWRASGELRKQLIRELSVRSLKAAVSEAKGEGTSCKS